MLSPITDDKLRDVFIKPMLPEYWISQLHIEIKILWHAACQIRPISYNDVIVLYNQNRKSLFECNFTIWHSYTVNYASKK